MNRNQPKTKQTTTKKTNKKPQKKRKNKPQASNSEQNIIFQLVHCTAGSTHTSTEAGGTKQDSLFPCQRSLHRVSVKWSLTYSCPTGFYHDITNPSFSYFCATPCGKIYICASGYLLPRLAGKLRSISLIHASKIHSTRVNKREPYQAYSSFCQKLAQPLGTSSKELPQSTDPRQAERNSKEPIKYAEETPRGCLWRNISVT